MVSFPGFDHLALWQVDVFSTRPLAGNPAAVVFGGEALDDETMQGIARETNLSETVFVLPPVGGADLRLRTFTTRREIAFAVHPSIAAAHAFSQASSHTGSLLTLECQLGRITLHRAGEFHHWHCKAPRARFQCVDMTVTEAARMFGLSEDQLARRPFQVVATGVPWLMIELAEVSDLDLLQPDHRVIAEVTRRHKAVGITIFSRLEGDTIARMRSFAPAEGIYEDPVCGSCAGSLAAMLLREEPTLSTAAFYIEQGHQLARPGRISLLPDDGHLWIGGGTHTVLRGQLQLGESECRV